MTAKKTIKEARKKTYEQDQELSRTVMNIIAKVWACGEEAILRYAEQFDHVRLETVRVDAETVRAAYTKVPEETVRHLTFAAERIRAFAKDQLRCLQSLSGISSIPGVELGHRLIPVKRCGCYIPSGRYPLPSSALMSVAVAKVAGVQQVAACSPPFAGSGAIHPAVLVAMDIAGADEIFCMGGAQAIAAYAYGAGCVQKVDLIAGPGNRFVTEAKRQVMGDVGIDGLAGPSEVLIIADKSANPRYVAIDLLAQAEHDPNARPMLVSTDQGLIDKTLAELDRLLETLPTQELAAQSWSDNGAIFLVDSLDDAAALSDEIAPEHVEVLIADDTKARDLAKQLSNYGSLFVGSFAPVVFGDFVSGTNHILPTLGTARYANGLWVGTFIKTPVHQIVSEQGCKNLAASAMHLAELEGLFAHREAVRLRISE
jgi:histidinol dehydrogenase/sulfopropanediol 3-dehydrogenase